MNKAPVAKDLKIEKEDLAVSLPLEINVAGKIYNVEPLFLIKGNNTFDFARKVEELGLRIRFTKIIPEQDSFEIQIFEKPQQAKDWLVFKAIEFPYINLYWIGTIVMVIGFFLSILRRKKELNTK